MAALMRNKDWVGRRAGPLAGLAQGLGTRPRISC